MDEEIRRLQRLASMGDADAAERLFHIIQRYEPRYGLTLTSRLYRCSMCSNIQWVSTNHEGPCSEYCRICSWKGIGYDEGRGQGPGHRVFLWCGYEPWVPEDEF